MGGEARAAILDRAADLFEADRAALMGLMVREAGQDACQCAGRSARGGRSSPLRGGGGAPELRRAARAQGPDRRAQRALPAWARACSPASRPGTFRLPSSPARSPAALAAGNAVVAKPAEQTPLTAVRAVKHLHAAGVPAGRPASPARAGRDGRRRAGPRSARRRRRLHRRHRHRDRHQPGARRARRPDRQAHRRDRRPELHDRRFLRAARAGGGRRARRRPSTAPASAARRSACSSSRRTWPTPCSTCCSARRASF